MYKALVARVRYHIQKANFMGLKEAESTLLLGEAADAIEELQAAEKKYLANISALETENQHLKREREWIPVTERVPEEGVSVQVCFRSQGGIAQAVSERFVDNRNQSYWSGLCGMKPTHWMPLPTPPTAEEGE